LSDVYEADHPPEGGERQGASGERVASNGVEDDVNALSSSQTSDPPHIIFDGKVDCVVRTERAHEVMVAGARRRDHPSADRLGDLNRYRTHATCAAMDEDCLAYAQLRALNERLPNCAAHQ